MGGVAKKHGAPSNLAFGNGSLTAETKVGVMVEPVGELCSALSYFILLHSATLVPSTIRSTSTRDADMSKPPLPPRASSSDTYDTSPEGMHQWERPKSYDSLPNCPPPLPLSSKPTLPPRPGISRFGTTQNPRADVGGTAPMHSGTHESSPAVSSGSSIDAIFLPAPPRVPPRANLARAADTGQPQAHAAAPEEMGNSDTPPTLHESETGPTDKAESAGRDRRASCDLEASATTQLSKMMENLEVCVQDARQREGGEDRERLFARSDHPPHLTPSPNGNFYTASSLPFGGNFDHSNKYFVGKECPNNETLSYGAFWFQHKDVPAFSICSTCFEFHIRRTVLENSFSCSVISADNQAARCMLGVPYMLRLLWPQAIASNDLQDVVAYMRARASTSHCHGHRGVAGSASEKVKWFQAEDNSIPGFICCETCYNAYIVGSSFENNFLPSITSQDPNDTWACDISMPYLNKAISEYSRTNRWSAFVIAAFKCLSTQPCAGINSVKAHTRKWYKCRDVMVCETCYLDKMAFTIFDEEFSIRDVVDPQDQGLDIICDLTPLPMRLSLAAALIDSNLAMFWNTIESQRVTPMCTKNGITGGTWYTLKGGCENFEVCQTCYPGMVSAFGLKDLFELQHERPPNQTSVCDFCPDAPRFRDYMVRYNIALNTPTKEPFMTFVKSIASTPLCRGSESYQSQWYSFQVAGSDVPIYVCRSCFE